MSVKEVRNVADVVVVVVVVEVVALAAVTAELFLLILAAAAVVVVVMVKSISRHSLLLPTLVHTVSLQSPVFVTVTKLLAKPNMCLLYVTNE